MLSSASTSVFASLGIFGHAPTFVSTSPLAFFGAGPTNPYTNHVTVYSLPAHATTDPLTHGYNLSQVKCH